MACIFCEIVSGNSPSSVIFEDNQIIAFMNIRPINKGEFMIIPKTHIDHFIDIPDQLASHIIIKAQELARIVSNIVKPKRMGYVVHGFGVAHAHLNVVPLHSENEITSSKIVSVKNGQIVFDHHKIPLTERMALDEMATQIVQRVRG